MSLTCWRGFLENSVFLDIPVKFLLLAKCQCLVMYSLTIILRNVQRMDITSKYVDAVIIKEEEKAAMELASQVALDLFVGKDLSYHESKEIKMFFFQ